ncbi:MAG: hypothetical protein RSB86_02925 [Comamonas sp.]|jgi:hypothetical protein|uniref:hypothetical protein n=1 Tax=Comamonas sp. TaxID=34028 RepID=UPI002FCC0E56
MTPRSPIAQLELALAGLLVATIAYLWVSPDLSIKNVRWVAPSAQPIVFQSLLEPVIPKKNGLPDDSKALLIMQERPLFVLGRKPLPPAPPEGQLAAPPEKNIWDQAKLLGIFEGAVKAVIFRAEGKDHRLLLNQSFEGWTLSDVQPKRIELRKAAQVRTLELQKADVASLGGKSGQRTAPAKPLPPRPVATAPTPIPAANPTASPAAAKAAAGKPATNQPPEEQAVFGGTVKK